MKITIGENISDELALELVMQVVKQGRISVGKNNRKIYCFATIFKINSDTKYEYAVITHGNTKTDCFYVYRKDI